MKNKEFIFSLDYPEKGCKCKHVLYYWWALISIIAVLFIVTLVFLCKGTGERYPAVGQVFPVLPAEKDKNGDNIYVLDKERK